MHLFSRFCDWDRLFAPLVATALPADRMTLLLQRLARLAKQRLIHTRSLSWHGRRLIKIVSQITAIEEVLIGNGALRTDNLFEAIRSIVNRAFRMIRRWLRDR